MRISVQSYGSLAHSIINPAGRKLCYNDTSRLRSFQNGSHPQKGRWICSAQVGEIPRAAALVIGNEILTGKIQDTNTATLAKLLFSWGVDLVKAEVVRDVREEIIDSLQRLRTMVGPSGFVFTSGGIGATHDDITYEAIAAAFGRELEVHEPTVEKMKGHYESQGKVLNSARLRMATLPSGCEVLETPGLWVPLALVENVYILPGIPRLYTKMVVAQKERFSGPLNHSDRLYTHQGEGEIADKLGEIAAKYSEVSIGSYPSTNSTDDFTAMLTFDGRNEDAVMAATADAEENFQCFRK